MRGVDGDVAANTHCKASAERDSLVLLREQVLVDHFRQVAG